MEEARREAVAALDDPEQAAALTALVNTGWEQRFGLVGDRMSRRLRCASRSIACESSPASIKGRAAEVARRGTGCGRRPIGCARRCSTSSAPSIAGARVLDGYAGTGAIGIEALSRGAAHVTFVEQDPRAVQTDRGEPAPLRGARDALCYHPRRICGRGHAAWRAGIRFDHSRSAVRAMTAAADALDGRARRSPAPATRLVVEHATRHAAPAAHGRLAAARGR